MTHKGWHLFCPVNVGFDDESLYMEPRHWSLEPVLWLAIKLGDLFTFLAQQANPDFPAGYVVKLTGKISPKSYL
jgi:hypothetical protein